MANALSLDRIDARILKALVEDGRITWSDLAEKVGLSTTPTMRRVRQLEDDGLIRGYTALLDETKLLGEIAVFISVTMDRQISSALLGLEAVVDKIPEVMSGHMMSGSSDFLLHAYVRDMPHYRQLLDRLTTIQGIAHIQSSFVLKTFLNRSAPLIEDASG